MDRAEAVARRAIEGSGVFRNPEPVIQQFASFLRAYAEEAVREQHQASPCVYQDAGLFWKAEALLQACQKGAPLDRLLLAAVIPVPIPHEVAVAHMEVAQTALRARETEAGEEGW